MSFLQAFSASFGFVSTWGHATSCLLVKSRVTRGSWMSATSPMESDGSAKPRISAGKASAGHSSSTTCCATNRNGPQFGS